MKIPARHIPSPSSMPSGPGEKARDIVSAPSAPPPAPASAVMVAADGSRDESVQANRPFVFGRLRLLCHRNGMLSQDTATYITAFQHRTSPWGSKGDREWYSTVECSTAQHRSAQTELQNTVVVSQTMVYCVEYIS